MVKALILTLLLFGCNSSVDSDFLSDLSGEPDAPIQPVEPLVLSAPQAIVLTGRGGETISPIVSWQAPENVGAGISHYELAIGTSAGNTDILNWKKVPGGSGVTTYTIEDSVDGFTLSLDYLTDYYVSVRAVDTENSVSESINSTWQISWTPRALGVELKAWFDGQDTSTFIVDGSTNVSDWADKSMNGLITSQVTPASRPAYVDFLNGKGLSFTTNTQRLVSTTATTLLDADGFSAYFVTQVPAVGSWRALLSTYNTQNFALYATSSGVPYRFYNGAHTATALQTSNAQVTGYIAKPNSNFIDRRDGVQVGSFGIGGVTLGANTFALGNYLINQSGTGRATIGEVILLETEASAAEWEMIEGYLAHKWGLEASLPGAHPYKTNPP